MSQAETTLGVGTALVSRRPVHGPDGTIEGFELRFGDPSTRPSGGAGEIGESGEAVVTATLLDAFSRFSAADLFGGRRGFVNLTRSFLVGGLPLPVAPEAATLMITADIVADGALVDGVRALVRSDFALALDGVPYSPELAPLLDLVTLVTVDVGARDWFEALDDARRYRAHGVRLLAKGVTSQVVLERCAEAGFELFVGDGLDRDESLDIETLSPNQAVALELVGRLSNPDTSIPEVENMVRHSPELAFRLLKIANSASSGSRREVGSLHDAIVLVGVSRLRSWMLLLSLSRSAAAGNALVDALTRAATCERLARATGTAGPESAFTVGLLDGVSDALGVAPGDLLARIPALSGELAETLQGRPGPLRSVLDAVVGYQHGSMPDDAEFAHPVMVRAYLEALAWTTRTSAVATD